MAAEARYHDAVPNVPLGSLLPSPDRQEPAHDELK